MYNFLNFSPDPIPMYIISKTIRNEQKKTIKEKQKKKGNSKRKSTCK